jgi:cellulose biosynthesis protein BcsQ
MFAKRESMAIVLATVNMKGGVGKTTLTVNLAASLAKYHRQRVLVVDLDTQVNATLSLITPQDFAHFRKNRLTLSTLISQTLYGELETNIWELIQRDVCTLRGLDLLPGDIELYDDFLIAEVLHYRAMQARGIDFERVWQRFESDFLRNILRPVLPEYDWVILDCAPSYNFLTRTGIMASDFYVIPCRPEPLSIVGTQLLERRINQLRQAQIEQPILAKLLGVVFLGYGTNLFNGYQGQVTRRVTDDFPPEQLFKTRIPQDVNLARAVDGFVPAILSYPNSPGPRAIAKFAEELLQKVSQL